MFTLLHVCRKSECELSGDQKPDRHGCTIRRYLTYRCVDLQSIRFTPNVEFRFIVARLISAN